MSSSFGGSGVGGPGAGDADFGPAPAASWGGGRRRRSGLVRRRSGSALTRGRYIFGGAAAGMGGVVVMSMGTGASDAMAES